jgi:hypothetical protein
MNSTVSWIGAAVAVAIVAFAVYRSGERRRVQRIESWIKDYVAQRYGDALADLHINCTDDRRWPVLVSFDRAATQTRHRLQFLCSGGNSEFALLSEETERRVLTN